MDDINKRLKAIADERAAAEKLRHELFEYLDDPDARSRAILCKQSTSHYTVSFVDRPLFHVRGEGTFAIVSEAKPGAAEIKFSNFAEARQHMANLVAEAMDKQRQSAK